MATRMLFGFISLAILLTFPAVALSSSLVYEFTFENDGDLTNPPFGTVTVSDDVADQLLFTIAMDTAKLGMNSDVHEFGFNLNFGGLVALVAAGDALDLLNPIDDAANQRKIQGRNSVFDYVAAFGTGTPILNPVEFSITGSGLDLTALDPLDISAQNNKPDANFAVHVQSTSPANPGSEALGGLWNPSSDIVITQTPTPEPGTLALLSLGILAVGAVCVRRRRS